MNSKFFLMMSLFTTVSIQGSEETEKVSKTKAALVGFLVGAGTGVMSRVINSSFDSLNDVPVPPRSMFRIMLSYTKGTKEYAERKGENTEKILQRIRPPVTSGVILGYFSGVLLSKILFPFNKYYPTITPTTVENKKTHAFVYIPAKIIGKVAGMSAYESIKSGKPTLYISSDYLISACEFVLDIGAETLFLLRSNDIDAKGSNNTVTHWPDGSYSRSFYPTRQKKQ